ncbi:MAG: tRNA (5-methylaminomethyl-2-thiouridine)(34)-methyltransferase MnmD [Flavobacteriales bacterium]|nr:tRNA (5-methylaminomethyl-2-thiouridine)(34)-methyltransferase MnmD [Flavobacteriales bacterium]MCB9365023.1 tRNA (5-methylaminomethyl-2-thiouridine)(34)-methyltransferase MnmD [Flavobacteriales bacterium]
MKIEIKLTKDNSHTLFIPVLNETYHSKHGAIQEANHVFIDAGLKFFSAKQLSVLEVGFGTGLNTLLTNIYAEQNTVWVDYIGVELHPLKKEIIEQLNYVDLIAKATEEQFSNIHNQKWNESSQVSKHFNLTKLNQSIAELEDVNKYDVIFFDAFGPEVQPEMWSNSIFKKMYSSLKEKGILVTFCAKGSVKRTLKEVGFTVENLPGPPGKREMTRAVKS